MQSISSYIFNSRIHISCICALITIITDSSGQITPPPPPFPDKEKEIVYKYVEKMPRLQGCEHVIGTESEKKACSDELFKKFFRSNLRYPRAALEQGIEGTIYVTFIVRPDGTITDPKLENKLGGGCEEEAIRLLRLFQEKCRFTPQSSRGRAVLIQFRTEIVFSLKQ